MEDYRTYTQRKTRKKEAWLSQEEMDKTSIAKTEQTRRGLHDNDDILEIYVLLITDNLTL